MKRLLTYLIFLIFSACVRKCEINKPIGLFPIKEFGKWGYINSFGQTVIKCQFEKAGQFSEGLAAIYFDSVWGFIDTTGKIVIKPQFNSVAKFSGGLCNVVIKIDSTNLNAFIRMDGSIAFTTNYNYISPFAFGRATTVINEEVCVIDSLGKLVFNTHFPFDCGSPLKDGILQVCGGTRKWVKKGLSEVMIGDTTRYYDKDGKLLLELEGSGFSNFKDDLAMVQIDGNSYFINKKGEIKIKPEKPEFEYFQFSDGLARVLSKDSDRKSGFIDKSGKIVIPIKYYELNDFNEGLAAYQDNNGWGFIDKNGRIAIKPQFEQIDNNGFINGLCKVKQNHQWGYINYKGEYVWKEEVGLQYKKLDLSKWDLDTLKLNHPLEGSKYAGKDNYPRKQFFAKLNEPILKVDTTDITVFADKYYAYKLYLINPSKDTIKIPAQDRRIKIIQQAKNKKGEWQDIENFFNSWCGNSYHKLKFAPNEFLIFATPIYKGEIKTQLRFKLELDKNEIYSNYYFGQINNSQFIKKKDKDKTGIVVWTN
jgi:hypothetical protein